jgi:3-hydroxyacyl-CoA dehydrogenase
MVGSRDRKNAHQEKTDLQVGFIGLGIMGASMAANLQKAGYQLVVHDIRQDSRCRMASRCQVGQGPQVARGTIAGNLHVAT